MQLLNITIKTPNLKVFQQKNTPDNFNIGVIHVKLKNWTTTRFPRISNKFHFILNETDNLEQLNKRRRNNNEVGESRGRRTEGSQPNRGNNEGSSNGRMEMDAIFPYLLLALGLALVVFFVILYAILNALLQRKDQHDSERRRKRKKRKRRRGRRGWRNDNNLIDREKQFEDDEENSSEEKHLDSIEEEGSNNLSRPVARWHRSRDGQLSPLEVDDENESDWMMTGGGGIRRYRQYKTTGSGRRVPPPLPQLPPPVHEIIPPRSRQLSQQHYPQHYARGQRHIGWANEDQISLPGILRSTPVIPPPPPPRVPPPPPPLPARYQRRRRRPPGEPSIENSSDENDDQSSDGGNRRNRVYNKRQQDENKRNNPPHPIKRENTDSTISSLHRGGSL